MKALAYATFALAVAGLAMPAAAACSWSKDKQQVEKPEEKVENPTT